MCCTDVTVICLNVISIKDYTTASLVSDWKLLSILYLSVVTIGFFVFKGKNTNKHKNQDKSVVSTSHTKFSPVLYQELDSWRQTPAHLHHLSLLCGHITRSWKRSQWLKKLTVMSSSLYHFLKVTVMFCLGHFDQ